MITACREARNAWNAPSRVCSLVWGAFGLALAIAIIAVVVALSQGRPVLSDRDAAPLPEDALLAARTVVVTP